MKHTEHYQLSQFEGDDRILREDFNADNAKIEQALTDAADVIEQANGKLNQLGTKLLLDYTYTGSNSTVEVDISSINWAEWHTVIIQFIPVTNTASGASFVCVGGTGSSDRIGMCRTQTGGEYYTSVIRLFPLFSDTARIASYNLSPENNGAYYASSRFSNCHTLYLVAGNTGVQLTNGTRVKIWGQT